MNLKLTFAALLIVPMMLTACAKKDEAPQAGQELQQLLLLFLKK